MKRACFILIAVLAVLLVYPASMPSAKSPSIDDSPTIIITPNTGPNGDLPSGTGSGDGDSGDADDLGFRGDRHTRFTTSDFEQTRFGAKVWWMYLLFHRMF
ncbi:MAG: hypothetical protein ACE5EO_09110 [Candidatus Krumholzibacteriia bacterium]